MLGFKARTGLTPAGLGNRTRVARMRSERVTIAPLKQTVEGGRRSRSRPAGQGFAPRLVGESNPDLWRSKRTRYHCAV